MKTMLIVILLVAIVLGAGYFGLPLLMKIKRPWKNFKYLLKKQRQT